MLPTASGRVESDLPAPGRWARGACGWPSVECLSLAFRSATGGVERGFEALELAFTHDFAEAGDEGIVDEVDDLETGFAAVDEVRVVESLEVARGVGLGEAQSFHQCADAAFAVH